MRKEKLLTPEEYTVRMGSLLRVFTTVVESLGDNLSPVKGGSIPKEFSCKVCLNEMWLHAYAGMC